MELYVFDAQRKLQGIIENFESLRWTRRYSAPGSFELSAIASPENIGLLKCGHYIKKSNDSEIGLIERLEIQGASHETLRVGGRFATCLLARRIVWGQETLSGDLSSCVATLLHNHLINPTDAARKIGGISFTPTSLGASVNTQISYRNLLESIRKLCEAADVGMRSLFAPETGSLRFELYKGEDSPAVFSRAYENILYQEYVEDKTQYANTALIGGEGEGLGRVFASITGASGEDRRELFVDAKDLRSDAIGGGYEEALLFRGQGKLKEREVLRHFDADISPYANLGYKTNFDLGQTATLKADAWGVSMRARITEVEETYDAEGFQLSIGFGQGLLTLARRLQEGD